MSAAEFHLLKSRRHFSLLVIEHRYFGFKSHHLVIVFLNVLLTFSQIKLKSNDFPLHHINQVIDPQTLLHFVFSHFFNVEAELLALRNDRCDICMVNLKLTLKFRICFQDLVHLLLVRV